jgi:hypothetical protein
VRARGDGPHGAGIMMSSDAMASPNSWTFLDGKSTLVNGQKYAYPISNLSPGPNYGMHWNTFLGAFVVCFMKWGSNTEVRIAMSDDMITWRSEKAFKIPDKNLWYPLYPFLIGAGGSLWGGQRMRLYYCSKEGGRSMRAIDVQFQRI